MERIYIRKIPSPIGDLHVIAGENHLLEILFPTGKPEESLRFWERRYGSIKVGENAAGSFMHQIMRELDEYFAGKKTNFTIPLRFAGTEFQIKVWNALRDIPYGETRSYRDVAAQTGNPRAMRAVGQANGANRIPIVIPCHRVINASGKIGGFGGGLEIKKQLLSLEKHDLFQPGFPEPLLRIEDRQAF